MPQAPKPNSDTTRPLLPNGRRFMVQSVIRDPVSVMAGKLDARMGRAVEIGALLVAPPDHAPVPVFPALPPIGRAIHAEGVGGLLKRNAAAGQHGPVEVPDVIREPDVEVFGLE